MYLIRAKKENSEFLYYLRNNDLARENSHNKNVITMEEHEKWLDSTLNSIDRVLLIAINGNVGVGVTRTDYIEEEDCFELSWMVSPYHRGKGVGKEMVKLLCDFLQSKIRAEIYKTNIPSIKIAEYAGLKLKKEENGILHYSSY